MLKVVSFFLLFITSMSFAVENAKVQNVQTKKTEVVKKKEDVSATTTSKKTKTGSRKPRSERKKVEGAPIKVKRMKPFKSQQAVKEKNKSKKSKANP